MMVLMKSSLQKRINQAEHLLILGPQPFSWKTLQSIYTSGESFRHLLVIFVDGGTIHMKKIKALLPTHYKNSFSIGDNDSSKIKVDVKKIDQNQSDLNFLLGWIIHLKPTLHAIHFFGFLGGPFRLDHLFVNLGTISRFQERISNRPEIMMDALVYFLYSGVTQLEIKTTFSLLSLLKNKVKISGDCQYPFDGMIDPLSSQGLSNVGIGHVKIKSNKPCLLILNKK